MPFCRKCGNQLKDDSVFCDKCGLKINLENEVKREKALTIKEEPKNNAKEGIKKIGGILLERAKIVAENIASDAKEGRGIFEPAYWEPPKGDPMKIDIPEGLTINSFNDNDIFGSKQRPNKRPYIPKALRVLIYRRDRGICGICGKKVRWDDYNIAHDNAFSKGGELSKANLFVAHPLCNRSMGTKSKKEVTKIFN